MAHINDHFRILKTMNKKIFHCCCLKFLTRIESIFSILITYTGRISCDFKNSRFAIRTKNFFSRTCGLVDLMENPQIFWSHLPHGAVADLTKSEKLFRSFVAVELMSSYPKATVISMTSLLKRSR